MQTPKDIYNQHSIFLESRPNVKIELSLYSWHSSKSIVCKSVDFPAFDATYKINPVDVMSFVNHLLSYFYDNLQVESIIDDAHIDLHKHHYVVETIRDIYSGKIDELLADDSRPNSNKVASFGFLGRENSKPQRQHYIELCADIPYLEYINTERFSWLDEKGDKFTSVLDLKRDHKYLFDLRGHTYSTKSYLFLASKRVFFSSEHNEKLWWEEKYLQPWKNFIPVKRDLSDLEEKYAMIEANPSLYDEIVANNISLLNNELSKDAVMKNLVSEMLKHIKLR